jgi:hypothetical protein
MACDVKRTQDDNRMRVLRAENVACMGEKRNAHRVLLGKPKLKRPLGRNRHR